MASKLEIPYQPIEIPATTPTPVSRVPKLRKYALAIVTVVGVTIGAMFATSYVHVPILSNAMHKGMRPFSRAHAPYAPIHLRGDDFSVMDPRIRNAPQQVFIPMDNRMETTKMAQPGHPGVNVYHRGMPEGRMVTQRPQQPFAGPGRTFGMNRADRREMMYHGPMYHPGMRMDNGQRVAMGRPMNNMMQDPRAHQGEMRNFPPGRPVREYNARAAPMNAGPFVGAH